MERWASSHFETGKSPIYPVVKDKGLAGNALAQKTEILLLDEPTTYLDMAHQLEVLQIVEKLNKEQKITTVMVLHDINHASRFSHEIITMKEGEIVKIGNPGEIITPAVLEEVFRFMQGL
jgi:iron complex transport system ATP-binding protein